MADQTSQNMKYLILLAVALTSFLVTPSLAQQTQAPDSLGLPGDNLNLYAVMKIFQDSKTLEEFERKLNDKENHINNLDLNNDNRVDYIKVIDHPKGNTHNIVMQVALNKKENQDVAVINVEKNEKGEVTFEMVGDEELYGKDYVVGPNYFEYPEGETPNPAYKRVSSEKKTDEKGNVTIINNYTKSEVAEWPMMMYLYAPAYSIWASPWYWDYYPPYWYPWEPWYWHQYYGWHYNFIYVYYGHYHHSHHYVCPQAHQYYFRHLRSVSPAFNNYKTNRVFDRTYSRPDEQKTGMELFNKEVEGKKLIMPERGEPIKIPEGHEREVPEKRLEKQAIPEREIVPDREVKPVERPVYKPVQPDIHEVPRQKAPEQPRIIRENPGKAREIQPRREYKRKTSSVRKKQENKAA